LRETREEMRGLLRLAAPLIVGFIGNQLMSFVDTMLVGRLGAAAIGGVGIGNTIFFAMSILAMGCALGADPLISQAVGAGEHARARRLLWQALRVAGIVSLPVMAMILAAPAILDPVGVEPTVSAATRSYLWGRVWNTIPLALFVAARAYLQAVGATRAIVVATVVANVVNVFAASLLIYGDRALGAVGLPGIGFAGLGVFGAGIASSLAAASTMSVLFAAVRAVEVPHDPERRRADWRVVGRVFALGIPVGLMMLVEVAAFAGAAIMSGRIGVVAAAGNQLALTLASMTFMVPLGVASATAVRVGQAIGRGDRPGMARAGFCGFAAGIGFMLVSATLFVAAPGVLARVLTNDAAVIAAAVPLIRIAAVFQLFDGMQVVGAGALRGAGDTRSGLWANLVGHFVVGLPLAVVLAFHLELGGPGLWWGLTVGLTIVGLVLLARFVVLARRPLVRTA
jgi:MATE family multidrug resistance protein